MVGAVKILARKRYLEEKILRVNDWRVSEKEKEFVHNFIKDYENGKITNRIGNNIEASIERNLDYLKFALQEINKDKPIKQDIEKFFSDLLKDKIKSFNKKTSKYNGKPYSIRGKKAIIDCLSKYLKWKFPDKLELLTPLKIRIDSKKSEPEFLTLDEIDKLYKYAPNPKTKCFIAGIFSSGARAEEFLNIRYSDVEMPKDKENFVKIRIRNGFSKTEGRTISLYYKNCLEAFREYLNQLKNEGIKPDEPIFKNYWYWKNWLIVFGNRVLKKSLHFHLFRHTSATWLADRMNRQQLCIYFGWKFSSPMPDVYINRNGVSMKEIDNKFTSTELEELKNKLEKESYEKNLEIEQQNKKLEDQEKKIEGIQKQREDDQKIFFLMLKRLKEGRDPLKDREIIAEMRK